MLSKDSYFALALGEMSEQQARDKITFLFNYVVGQHGQGDQEEFEGIPTEFCSHLSCCSFENQVAEG